VPRKDEIDRMIVLLYRSRNSHGYTNFSRSIDWMDKLPMAGLEELEAMFENMAGEVRAEIEKRHDDGIEVYSREYAEAKARRDKLSRLLGVDFA
jgi:hypothetical protein